MNERLKLGLKIAGVVVVVAAILGEMIWLGLRPVLEWQRERRTDFAAFEKVRHLQTRAEVEGGLTGWNAKSSPVSRCEVAARAMQKPVSVCKEATQEVAYRRVRSGNSRPGGINPLQILAIYDANGRAIVITTFD